MQLNSPCMLNSAYEIWETQGIVRHGDREVYRAFATPAVFDPITVFDPGQSHRARLRVGPRMTASSASRNDWSGHRGCHRESYAQPGYWFNAAADDVTTPTRWARKSRPSDPACPGAGDLGVQQRRRTRHRDGLAQFKMRRDYCGLSDQLGLKN